VWWRGFAPQTRRINNTTKAALILQRGLLF